MLNQRLRLMEWTEDEELRFGPFRLIPRERRLEREGKPVRIGGRGLDVLLCLIANAPDVVSRSALIRQVWPNLVVEDGSLRYQIAILRRTLEDGADGKHYVVTVQGRGHAFVARVSRSLGVQQRSEVIRGIYGQPSAGKATVAEGVADAPASPLEGTVRLVEFGALAAAALDPATLASFLGFSVPSAGPSESLASLLRDKRVLLILDSGEYAIPAASRPVKTQGIGLTASDKI